MQFARGIPCPDENGIQIQGNWIPVTPSKPETASARFYGNGFFQEKARQNDIPSSIAAEVAATAQFNSAGFADRTREIGNLEAALAAQAQVSGLDSYTEAFRNTTARWNNMMHGGLSAFTGMAFMAATDTCSSVNSFPPILHPQKNSSSNQQEPNLMNPMRTNQNPVLGANLQSNSHFLTGIPQYGFSIPYRTTYNLNTNNTAYHLNTPAKTRADAITNGSISSQLAPETPNQGWRETNGRAAEFSVVGERVVNEEQKQEGNLQPAVMPPSGMVPIEVCSDQAISQPVEDSYPAVLSTPAKETNNPSRGDNHIDLNKTPHQKRPKRKKHMPKVVVEGKPKRTPKPPTPPKGNPLQKRKYVRKNGLKASMATSSADVGEVLSSARMHDVKSCKRALNFDSEGRSGDGCSGNAQVCQDMQNSRSNSSAGVASCAWAFDLDPESEAGGGCAGIKGSSGPKSTMELAQGLEVVVGNSQVGILFDFNRSFTPLQGDHISHPKNPNPSTPLLRKEPPRGHMKGACRNISDSGHIPMHENAQAEERDCLIRTTEAAGDNYERNTQLLSRNGLPSVSKIQHDSSASPHVWPAESHHLRKVLKREYIRTIDDAYLSPMNLCGTHYTQFPGIYKKRRTDTRHNDVISNVSSMMALDGGIREAMAKSANETGSNTFMLLTSDGRPFPLCNIVGGTKTQLEMMGSMKSHVYSQSMVGGRSAPSTSGEMISCVGAPKGINFNELQAMKARTKGNVPVCDSASLSAATEHEQLPPASAKAAPTCNYRQDANVFHGPRSCSGALVADNNAEMTTKKCHLANPVFHGTNQMHQQEHETAYDHRQFFVDMNPIRSSQHFQPRSSNISFIPDHQSSRDIQWMLHSNLLSEAMVPVQRMECPGINSSSKLITDQAQNALVPYVGDGKMVPYEGGQMVPYEGPFDPTKGRRTRAIVDVDHETERLWNVLMGKADDVGTDAMDADKEKWWEEERRVFRGRADSFIARMHLIQGDRRFSRWKGSVVDSVVGVFLTQNVSDHLSSSAYMNLAARFPPQSRTKSGPPHGEGISPSAEEQGACMLVSDKWSGTISGQKACDQGSMTLNEADPSEEKEMTSCNESFGSNTGVCTAVSSKDEHSAVCQNVSQMCQESAKNTTDTPPMVTESAWLADSEDRRGLEDVVSSQTSVISSQNSPGSIVQTADQIESLDSISEADNLILGFNSSMSFTELLQMEGSTLFQEFYTGRNGRISSKENFEGATSQFEVSACEKRISYFGVDGPIDSCLSIDTADSHQPQAPHNVKDVLSIPSNGHQPHRSTESGSIEPMSMEVSREGSRYYLPSTASEISEITEVKDSCHTGKRISLAAGNEIEITVHQRLLSTAQTAQNSDPLLPIRKHPVHLPPCSAPEACVEWHPFIHPRDRTNASSGDVSLSRYSHLQSEQTLSSLRGREAETQYESTEVAEHQNQIEPPFHRQHSRMQQSQLDPPSYLEDSLDVAESSSLVDKKTTVERKIVRSDSIDEACSSKNMPNETTKNALKKRKEKSGVDKTKAFDWDSLRKQAGYEGLVKERHSDAMDSVDWEAVRCADVKAVSETIKERGMNNMLSERIQEFLNRVVSEHGSIDLEWLRDVPPDKAKDYFLSIRGLGLKSTECVRLLTLHHVAFPVDTNVGRVSVRLGWVPLRPLPESVQIHLLEQYPVLASVQKYLWPRLCTLDQRTLYELHYQMITFGKVFCTKKNPNCNACPMRTECKHFASAFASARLALPGPEEKGLVSLVPKTAEQDQKVVFHPMPLPRIEGNPHSQGLGSKRCEPIIEEPTTPEPENIDISETAIEDAFWQEDPEDIPTIKLNLEEFTQNVQNYMHENNMELQDADFSKALVALSPQAASIPVPKLKNVGRLRTEHQVYELPDSHPLLAELDRREPDDPCSYLLAIWTPGETADSIQPPGICCNSQESGSLCDKKACFSCNSIREENSQTVRGTLLIPCRTAMRGSFPLNGTYFQVNEVFADHDTSIQPIDVPRALIWNLPRRTVYFGTSIPTIFQGLTTEGIQQCFWRGFVCVRGFDRKTRAPRPLTARQHLAASKLVRLKRTENSK
ncbi:protein ROS1A-like [Magnolia sinica]|uniref:protein ROS1A-like n=1 Tax=Magnolia sinica TaxID=86752 RepID=UPI0026580DDF|nr:protein ROS1A-like [Magnolia sinica]